MRAMPKWPGGEVLTVTQVAEYLQLNKLTIYKYIREGMIPAVRIGRVIRVRTEDVARFLETQKVAPKVGSSPEIGRIRARAATRKAAARARATSKEDIYIGPQQPERGRPREAVIPSNPMDWVIRGLH